MAEVTPHLDADGAASRGGTVAQPAPRKRAAAEKVTRPHAKTTERREAVLRAALAVFGARGYNNAALAEVAEQAGMTHAGVLHHFGSKEGLLIAVLRYRDGEAIAGVAGRQQVEGPAFLEHLIDTVHQNETRPGVVQTYTVLAAESVTDGHPAQEYFRGRMARLRAKLEEVMGEVSGGLADPGDVRDAANALIAVMDGLQVQWLLDPRAVDMPRTVTMVLDELIERLASGATAPSALDSADRALRARNTPAGPQTALTAADAQPGS
jgi:AcrR family transcriptional regulator